MRRALRALLLASAAGYAAGFGCEAARSLADAQLERALVYALETGVLIGWASCSCWGGP